MQFDPNSKWIPLETGVEYKCQVAEAKEKISKSGSPYINLKLYVYGKNQNADVVWDILTTHPKMIHKLESACKAFGLDFSRGSVNAEDFDSKEATVVLRARPDGKLEPEKYDAANDIPF